MGATTPNTNQYGLQNLAMLCGRQNLAMLCAMLCAQNLRLIQPVEFGIKKSKFTQRSVMRRVASRAHSRFSVRHTPPQGSTKLPQRASPSTSGKTMRVFQSGNSKISLEKIDEP